MRTKVRIHCVRVGLSPLLILLFCFYVASVCMASENALSVRYAKGFTIEKQADGVMLTIRPQGGKEGRGLRYLLVPRGGKTKPAPSGVKVIAVPVQRLVVLSTTPLAYIDAAGCTNRIVGLAGSKYVNTPSVIKRIQEGRIKEVGKESAIRIEALMDLSPDLIIDSGAASAYENYPKLTEVGLSIMDITDFMEAHPLGRFEWIKILSLLLGTEEHAVKLFNDTALRYNQLTAKAASQKNRPRILTGTPFQGQWWIAKGGSFTARYITDAGGDYLWSNTTGSGSTPMDVETVYERSMDADIWINTGTWERINQAKQADPRFGTIPALEKGQLYNNNKRVNNNGGNDFWESGMLRPDEVLSDLISIFHPDLLPGRELVYYRKLTR